MDRASIAVARAAKEYRRSVVNSVRASFHFFEKSALTNSPVKHSREDSLGTLISTNFR